MATQASIASLIERYFQDYADAAEIKKILVDPNTAITQPNQLITRQYALDNHAAAGAEGPQGPIGHTGVQGPPGVDGPEGPAGQDGHDGAHGTGINLLSSVATATDLPGTGNTIADAHMTRDDGHIHMWDGNQWVDGGKILGPVGPQGIRGLQGLRGVNGIQGIPGVIGPVGPRGAPGYTKHQQFTDRNAINSHPYTAISDIQRVFTDRLVGFLDVGILSTRSTINGILKNSAFFTNQATAGTFPQGSNKRGIIVTYMMTVTDGMQKLYGTSTQSGKSWSRLITAGISQPWTAQNVSGGTGAPPAAADDGELWIQY